MKKQTEQKESGTTSDKIAANDNTHIEGKREAAKVKMGSAERKETKKRIKL